MGQHHPSFLACRQCGTVQWMSAAAIERYGRGVTRCRRCCGVEWRLANVYPTLRERFYLLRWYVWEQNYVNRPGLPGADPSWYLKPWLLAKVLRDGLTIMRAYNNVSLEADGECPRNIANLRAELSRRSPDAHSSVLDATVVLPRQRGHSA